MLQLRPFIYTTTEDGKEVYKGLCVDLINMLSERMGFSYNISDVEDGRVGGQDEDGNWMGLIGDLVNRVSNRHTQLSVTCYNTF